jgi:GNAT superfamily N-acetyltransferase
MISIRPAQVYDEPFLWRMLYVAAHMADDNDPFESIFEHPSLARYVKGWPRDGDVGVVALDTQSGRSIGAAWFRLLIGDEKDCGYVDDVTPQMALGVQPIWQRRGVGTLLVQSVLEAAKPLYAQVALTVRKDNPASALYLRMGFVQHSEVVNRVGTNSSLMLYRY